MHPSRSERTSFDRVSDDDRAQTPLGGLRRPVPELLVTSDEPLSRGSLSSRLGQFTDHDAIALPRITGLGSLTPRTGLSASIVTDATARTAATHQRRTGLLVSLKFDTDRPTFPFEAVKSPDERRVADVRGFSAFCHDFMRWGGFPALVLVALILAAAILTGYFLADVNLRGTPVYLWLTWAGVLVLSWLVVHPVMMLILLLIKRIMKRLSGPFSVYYYINHLHFTLSVIFWTAINFAVWSIVLVDLDDDVAVWIRLSFTCLVVVSVLRTVKLVADKIIISRIQSKQFWKDVMEALFREKVLHTLLLGVKKRKLNKILKAPISNRVFGKAWRYILKNRRDDLDDIISRSRDRVVTHQEAVETTEVLFSRLDDEHKGYFEFADVQHMFKHDDEALAAFALFDRDKDGKAARDEATKAIYQIIKDRRALYNTLNDRENIAAILSNVIGVVFWFLMALLCSLIFGANPQSLLLPMTTTILGLAFIFGNSVKSVWEAFLFVFFVRPFDIGDRITFETFPTLIVARIGLLSVEAFTPDGKHVIVPTPKLAAAVVYQYKRSRDYAVQLDFDIDFYTSKEKVLVLIDRIRQWLATDTKASWKSDEATAEITAVKALSSMTITVWAELRDVNWQTPSLFNPARHSLWLAVADICKELDVRFYNPPNRTFTEPPKELPPKEIKTE